MRSDISSFELSSNVQNVVIGNNAFWDCKLLSKVFINAYDVKIGKAFPYCKSLSEVLINASNLKIEASAFCDCQALKKVIGPPNTSEAELKDFEKFGIEYVNSD